MCKYHFPVCMFGLCLRFMMPPLSQCASLIRCMYDPFAAFRPNNAVALSNVAIVGGAVANFAFNWRRRHPSGTRSLIDW
jgi:hypothetical protein